jgi:uncharacterized damage-inducible protein DinB
MYEAEAAVMQPLCILKFPQNLIKITSNMKEYFVNYFEYTFWANERTFKSISELINPPDKAVELFSHMIISQIVWLDRILKKPSQYKTAWQKFSPEECEKMFKRANAEWISFISNTTEDDFEEEIEYRNTKGESFRNKIKDIIIHVINHSTYHRGQIASLVRNAEGQPAVTDYIAYKR